MSVRTVKITPTHITLDILSITTKHNMCPFMCVIPVKASYPHYHLGTNESDQRKGLKSQSVCRRPSIQATEPLREHCNAEVGDQEQRRCEE